MLLFHRCFSAIFSEQVFSRASPHAASGNITKYALLHKFKYLNGI